MKLKILILLVELTSLTLGKDATLNVNNAIKNIPAVNSNIKLTSLTLGKDATLNVNNAIKNIPAVNSNIKSSLLMSITSLQEDSEQSS